MDWKKIVGWILVAFGVVGVLQDLGGATNSYGIGQLAGAVLFVAGGVWLVLSGKPQVRT